MTVIGDAVETVNEIKGNRHERVGVDTFKVTEDTQCNEHMRMQHKNASKMDGNHIPHQMDPLPTLSIVGTAVTVQFHPFLEWTDHSLPGKRAFSVSRCRDLDNSVLVQLSVWSVRIDRNITVFDVVGSSWSDIRYVRGRRRIISTPDNPVQS